MIASGIGSRLGKQVEIGTDLSSVAFGKADLISTLIGGICRVYGLMYMYLRACSLPHAQDKGLRFVLIG